MRINDWKRICPYSNNQQTPLSRPRQRRRPTLRQTAREYSQPQNPPQILTTNHKALTSYLTSSPSSAPSLLPSYCLVISTSTLTDAPPTALHHQLLFRQTQSPFLQDKQTLPTYRQSLHSSTADNCNSFLSFYKANIDPIYNQLATASRAVGSAA